MNNSLDLMTNKIISYNNTSYSRPNPSNEKKLSFDETKNKLQNQNQYEEKISDDENSCKLLMNIVFDEEKSD